MANIVFEFVDGSREIVWPGGPRHKELLAQGHTPVDSAPPSDGISDTLQAYLDGRFNDTVTRVGLESKYVRHDGSGSQVVVDFATPVRPAQRMQQDVLTVTATGDLSVVLGAAPIANQVAAWVKSGSAVPARLMPTSYTVAGEALTIPTLLAGDKVLIEYMYDADAVANPATASSNQYDLYDNFARTTTAGAQANVATAIGAAVTGQMPTIYNGGSWGVDGSCLYKSVAGANAGAGDGVHWTCGSADGWLETVFGTGSGILGAAGLVMRAVDSTSRLQTSNNGLFERVASTSTRITTYSQTLVPGDGHGVLMTGTTIKSYRRVGNAGPWLLVSTVTSAVNQTLRNHGIRNADTTNPLTKYDHIKFIAGATQPPVVA